MYKRINRLAAAARAGIQHYLSEGRLEQLQKIWVGKSKDTLKYEYSCKILYSVFLVFVITLVLVVLSILIGTPEAVLKQGHRIERQEPGGNPYTLALRAEIAGNRRKLTVCINPREYTAEELQAKFEEAKRYITEHYLGENVSAEQVSSNLNLIRSIPGNAIHIEWQTDGGDFIEEDGQVCWDRVEKETQVEILARLSYQEREESMPLELTLWPQKKSEEEQMWEEWQKAHRTLQEETGSEKYLSLPEEIRGKPVVYHEQRISLWKYVLLAGIVGILFIPLLFDSRIRQRIECRDKELRRDYPELLEQFVLLIGAGLTIRGAWQKIATDYQEKITKGRQKYRFVYEEMLVTMRELESGMSERKAYELFGKRIGILSYMRFSTLLVQNLRKGSADLLRLLEYEASDAFRVRKENAKILGEEASTKLLMPMILMLVIILVMILYAAFHSM